MFNQFKFTKATQAKHWDIAQILDDIGCNVMKLKALTQNIMDGQKPGVITQAYLEAQRLGQQLMPWTGSDGK